MANASSPPQWYIHLNSTSKCTLFSKEGDHSFRIPALIYINDCKTFLAFAERRKSSKDESADELFMKRGEQKDGKIEWSSPKMLTTRLEGYRVMNPCPVYKSKTLFLFFICVEDSISEQEQIKTGKNVTRLCYIKSSDDGKTWDKTTDLTDSVIGAEYKNWATFGVGPGHGIQMKSGKLIIPAYCYSINKAKNKKNPATPYALAFYSDDDGKTWKMSEKIKLDSIECQMAELIDQKDNGQLYCNARTSHGKRVEAWSKGSAIDFNQCEDSKTLVETGQGCQGSVLSFSMPEGSKKESSSSKSNKNTWLFYSHPSDSKSRKDLGIYLNTSPFSTSGWTKLKIICNGPSGYSDLTQCEDRNSFACLMECGEHKDCERIDFLEFLVDDKPECKRNSSDRSQTCGSCVLL